MRIVKKFALFMPFILLYFIFTPSLRASAVFAPNFEVYSQGVYMVNLDTDIAIVSKNADQKLYPASTTKIMTALVSLANIKDFNAYAKVTYEAFNEFSGSNPNYAGGVSNAEIQPLQSNVTYWDLLYSLMVCSACESANILAYNVGGGSIQNFVAMMNSMAEEIGCKNTHFSNPHGLFDENNYTTAYDLYLITKYAIDNYPRFMEICDTYSYDMPPNSVHPDGYTITHTNGMMRSTSQYYYEGVHGIKTGSIDRYYRLNNGAWEMFSYGSRALVTTAQRQGNDGRGYNYLIVSLGAPYFDENGVMLSENYSCVDHINLYNWAFGEFVYTDVVLSSEQICQIDVDKGLDADKVGVAAAEDYYTLLPKSLDKSTIQQIRHVEDMLEAPIKKGTEVGDLELRLNGETLTKIKLVTEADVELNMMAYYTEKIKNIISTPQFIAIIVVLVLLIILYITARTIRINHNRKIAEMNRRRKINMAPRRTGGNSGKNRRR